jgi:SAM-dependent methyltransferase
MIDARLARLTGPQGPSGTGLEIGPRDAPLVRRPDYDVRYVDYTTTEALRAAQFDPSVRLDQLVEVDIVWGERPLGETLAAPVDFVVASHVIEHVPDLIGWLAELHAALRPGGVLGLAVPDRRFTFDALRRVSTLAEAVEANLLGYRQPSLRQVFDAAWLGITVDAVEAWECRLDPAAARAEALGRIRSAHALAKGLAAAPRYNDAHCWVFTPSSFLDLAEELATLGAFPFAVDAFHPTEPGKIEFHVRLRALAPDEADQALASIRAAQAAPADHVPAAEARDDPKADLAALALDNQRLRQALDAIRASTSWRITAPLRGLARLARGRQN